MPVTSEEIIGRQVTNDKAERQYHLHGPADEEDVVDYVATLPVTLAGFPFSDFTADEHEDIAGDWILRVTYGTPDTPSSEQDPGTSGYRFSYQAPSAHIYQSLATINSYADATLLGFGAPDFDGAINVVNDGGKLRVEGYNLQPPPEVFTIPYSDIDATITAGYQATVRGICGTVNNASYYGAAAGELMLVRAEGERTGGLWNLEFGFSYVPNDSGLVLGGITGIAKDGMDLLWPYYLPVKDDTAKELVKKPAAVYIERVYRRTNFSALALPF